MQDHPTPGGSRPREPVSRRNFLKSSAALSTVALAPGLTMQPVFTGGSDDMRVGLIGCGGRGGGAASNCVTSSRGVRLVALGDLFPDRLMGKRRQLAKRGDAYVVADDHCFSGFDAYERVLSTDCNLVILATPPAFRPQHLAAAIRAGKNVFMEKPVAVCPAGVRSVIASAELAAKKGLAIVAGTQRRHQTSYLDTIKRIHDGAIGDVVAATCYWNQGGLWKHDRKEAYSDVEWQIRNWLYFAWASGDHIVEQHVHNIDVMNWVFGGPPVKARGMGGRQVRTSPAYGHIFDHFAIEYEYKNGAKVTSMCRQIGGAWRQVGEHVVGTKGHANPGGWIKGEQPFSFPKERRNKPYVQEHTDLILSIREGKPLNEGRRIAESTLTAIMGRMSAYTGKVVTFDHAMRKSQLDLMPKRDLAFGDLPVEPVATPGITKLI